MDDRIADALFEIAGALKSIARTMEIDSQMKYPPKKEPKDVTLHYVKSDEEKLIENQGGTGEATTEEWTDLGPRERAYLEAEKRQAVGTPQSNPVKVGNNGRGD